MRWLLAIGVLAGCDYKAPVDQQPADDGPGADAMTEPDSGGGGVDLDAPPDAPITPCQGYTPAGTSNYLVVTAPADWPTAKTACEQAANGHLVVIADSTENTLVRGMLPITDRFWMGFSDIDTENTWLWLDNTAVPRAVELWDGGQPNDNQTFGGEDCGEMSNAGTWNDKNCANTQQYICECP